VEKKEKIIFKEKAKQAILDIALYIENRGYPETAEKFAQKLVLFANSLASFPKGYPICKQKQFAKYQLHCAVFHKNYIFVYKLIKNTVVVYTVIHTNTSVAFYSV
jgi:plasmid stabilization system protein ParE